MHTSGVQYYRARLFKLFSRYHCSNTKHADVPLGTANINAYFQDISLPGCFTVETSNFAVAAFLVQHDETIGEFLLIFEK
jgi:hypothetical protein